MQETPTPPNRTKFTRHLLVLAVGATSLLYLLNIGAGIFELIPDNFPLIGNLDEAAATFLLINCLAYFGLDLRNLFQSAQQKAANKGQDRSSTESK